MKILLLNLSFLLVSFIPNNISGDKKLWLISQLELARSNPKAFGEMNHFDLSMYKPAHKLIQDAELMNLAQERAIDMARNKKLSHTDSRRRVNKIKHKGLMAESIAYSNRTNHIFVMIEDKGVKDLGHRKHLLGIIVPKHNAYGIGLAKGDNGLYYCCILTQKKPIK